MKKLAICLVLGLLAQMSIAQNRWEIGLLFAGGRNDKEVITDYTSDRFTTKRYAVTSSNPHVGLGVWSDLNINGSWKIHFALTYHQWNRSLRRVVWFEGGSSATQLRHLMLIESRLQVLRIPVTIRRTFWHPKRKVRPYIGLGLQAEQLLKADSERWVYDVGIGSDVVYERVNAGREKEKIGLEYALVGEVGWTYKKFTLDCSLQRVVGVSFAEQLWEHSISGHNPPFYRPDDRLTFSLTYRL